MTLGSDMEVSPWPTRRSFPVSVVWANRCSGLCRIDLPQYTASGGGHATDHPIQDGRSHLRICELPFSKRSMEENTSNLEDRKTTFI